MSEQRRLLIVGSGFIAANLALMATNKWAWHVNVVYRNYKNPLLKNIDSTPLPSNVTDMVSLLEKIKPTDVVIALGSSFVPDINRDLDVALTQHLNGPLMVMDAVSRMKIPLPRKILILGSASEYGKFGAEPVAEDHQPQPQDHYGLIKLSLRHVGLHYFQNHNLPVIHVRQFNVTGPDQDKRFVLPSICSQVAQVKPGQQQKIIAGNTSVRRDFLAISDVCEAYAALLSNGSPGTIYNVCSGQAYSISDLIQTAAKLRGIDVDIEVSEQLLRENDKVQPIICGDPSRLQQLGWKQQTSMLELLSLLIEKYRFPNQE